MMLKNLKCSKIQKRTKIELLAFFEIAKHLCKNNILFLFFQHIVFKSFQEKKLLNYKMSLGLDIGSEDILSEFYDKIKPKNFIYILGIEVSLKVK